MNILNINQNVMSLNLELNKLVERIMNIKRDFNKQILKRSVDQNKRIEEKQILFSNQNHN